MTDQIYAKPKNPIKPFAFDDQVADVFHDMIQRSVPGYNLIRDLISPLGEDYIQSNTQVYDLGCSLGALGFTLAQNPNIPACHIQGIDNARPMIERCQATLNTKQQANSLAHPIRFTVADIRTYSLKPCSFVLVNFVLQFIEPAARNGVLERIYQALNPGGALLISEKVTFANEPHQARMQRMHHQFKAQQGYSGLEISQKRTALENVLVPDELTHLEDRLHAVGFAAVHRWLQCCNFVSILAVKKPK